MKFITVENTTDDNGSIIGLPEEGVAVGVIDDDVGLTVEQARRVVLALDYAYQKGRASFHQDVTSLTERVRTT